ncbi:MAG TPA: sulfite exporter TauE/SafE family protein [Pyrinomonadaceae bacterium]|nr:sulfite exporter TauE/SafE family protein [Pyrinomonadaceae bacterium]
MTTTLVILLALFFVTSVVGVVTGSNSLITVPAMYQLGMDPRVAVATNMFGLTFMSAGGALPFVGKGTIDRARLPRLILLTLAGSVAGALLVLVVPSPAMPVFVSVSMLAVALFTLLAPTRPVSRDAGATGGRADLRAAESAAADDERSAVADATRAGETGGREDAARVRDEKARGREWMGYAVTFALGVYGGFFSGGYVTLLTAAFVALFRMRFVEAVATTKVVNVCSSLVATIVFIAGGLVDFRLGALLAVVMFAGAFVGARVALRLNERALRVTFLATVVALALKILLYDLLWKGLEK